MTATLEYMGGGDARGEIISRHIPVAINLGLYKEGGVALDMESPALEQCANIACIIFSSCSRDGTTQYVWSGEKVLAYSLGSTSEIPDDTDLSAAGKTCCAFIMAY